MTSQLPRSSALLATLMFCPISTAAPITVNIQAFIDGLSRITLRANTAQWKHLVFAAPGRHESLPFQPT